MLFFLKKEKKKKYMTPPIPKLNKTLEAQNAESFAEFVEQGDPGPGFQGTAGAEYERFTRQGADECGVCPRQ